MSSEMEVVMEGQVAITCSTNDSPLTSQFQRFPSIEHHTTLVFFCRKAMRSMALK